jgi:transitional endoplasmic reticulum ATPase
MSFLYQKKLEHETRCEEALLKKAHADAVFHAAKAAEFAYALAEQTAGPVAERYVKDAEGWLEIAEKIRKQPAGSSNAPARAASPQSEDDKSSPDEAWLVAEKPNVTFEMIAGMSHAKAAIRQMIIHPLSFPEKARALGLKAGGGVLLFGPPGNGKTMLGKAIANELDSPFFYASGAHIRSKWHGESEQRLRKLIRAAKEQPVAVLFLDEVEGLLPKRGGSGSVVDNRIVTQFLAEIGGFEESENILLLLGATNLPWNIDEAVFRTGRFDEKIFIGLPDVDARQGIIERILDQVQIDENFSARRWAEKLDGYTGSDLAGLLHAAKRACLGRSIAEESDPVLLESDLEQALRQIPASVTPSMMDKYQAFNETRFR